MKILFLWMKFNEYRELWIININISKYYLCENVRSTIDNFSPYFCRDLWIMEYVHKMLIYLEDENVKLRFINRYKQIFMQLKHQLKYRVIQNIYFFKNLSFYVINYIYKIYFILYKRKKNLLQDIIYCLSTFSTNKLVKIFPIFKQKFYLKYG